MKPPQLEYKDVPTIRILVLGENGVGKTSVTNLMASSVDTPTVASRSVSHRHYNIQVRLHEYPSTVELPPTPSWTSPSSSSERSDKYLFPRHMPATTTTTTNMLYFVEFVDLSSQCPMHRNHMFHNIDGIVLVYNLLDTHSQDSLHDWLYEPLRQISKHRHRRYRSILGSKHVPILVMGTKLDKLKRRPLRRSGGIAHQLGAEEILLNTQDPESFADQSRNQGKLRVFLNRAVEFKERYPHAHFRDP